MSKDMVTPKYELTDETKEVEGRVVHRIRALVDTQHCTTGELGGFIESEQNLSQDGNCWVRDDAVVCGLARVADNALVYDDAIVMDKAIICDEAVVSRNAIIKDTAHISGKAVVKDIARVGGSAIVTANGIVKSNAKVRGTGTIRGESLVSHHADISESGHVFSITGIGSENGTFTAYRDDEGGISCTRGCFSGTIQEFENEVELKHGSRPYTLRTYKAVIELTKLRIKTG